MKTNDFQPTPTSERLYKELLKIHKDRDFIGGVFSMTTSDEEWQEVLNFIEANDNVTSEDVLLFAMTIPEERLKRNVRKDLIKEIQQDLKDGTAERFYMLEDPPEWEQKDNE